MDGLLLVDKPAGPTSHDVVERMRVLLGERRIGHTGTLDPAATGLLPLVLGRATRLARFLTARDKRYEAAIRLGLNTSSGDADGDPAGLPFTGTLPLREAIERALDAFRGTFAQQPPALSAKRSDLMNRWNSSSCLPTSSCEPSSLKYQVVRSLGLTITPSSRCGLRSTFGTW